MSVHVFDPALHEANVWIKDVMDRLISDDPHLASVALKATLHTLRDRIGLEPAAHLGAQLPTLIRGLYYEGWRPSDGPGRERHVDAFLDRVAESLPSGLRPEAWRLVRAVFSVLEEKVAGGETRKIAKVLPEELRRLWLETAPAG
jgi:uncharacterized protein (DUF2267 family)